MQNKEHVLMFGWEYPPHHSGGLGVACEGMVKGLRSKGKDVAFVLPEYLPGYTDPQLLFVDESRKHLDPNFMKSADIANLLKELSNPYLSTSSYEVLCAIYKRKTGRDYSPRGLLERVDAYKMQTYDFAKKWKHEGVVHAHDWLSFGAGIAAKEVTGNPLVVHVHATEYDRVGGNDVNWEVFKREKIGMDRADRIVAVSDITKNKIIDKYSIHGDKIDVVHNGSAPLTSSESIKLVKKKLFGDEDVPVILSHGRLTIQKGIEFLLEAAKLVVTRVPKAHFIISGSGDMERQIIKRSAELGLQGRVFFPGAVWGEEAQALYELADVFVMPSVSEPFGIVPLESLHAGTPVIISKQSGVSEVLSHALRVDFWDTEELANKIVAVITHEPLRKTLAHNGKKEAQALTWERATDKLLSVYSKLATI